MTYTVINFKTKKALKEAVAAGWRVAVFEPGIGRVHTDGKVYLEGPHAPEPHTWYAVGFLENGKVVKIK